MTVEPERIAEVTPVLDAFLSSLPQRASGDANAPSPFAAQRAFTGWAASVPVSYVARVFRAVPFTHPDSAALLVLARLLKADFLHREIREKGGAYGGMASFDPESGLFAMLSYRDPNIARTLRVYHDAARWASEGLFADSDVKEAILSVFSSLDRPLSPGGRGNREFNNQIQGMTPEMRQQLRERILATDRRALKAAAETYLLGGWDGSAVSVIGNEEALRAANAELPEGERLEIRKI